MRKIGNIIVIILIYFLLYFLQVNFFNWFTIYGVKPNLFILLALFSGIFMGKKYGTILGIIMGLYTDFLFSNSFGISAILFGIAGFCGDFIDKKFSNDNKLTIVIVGVIATAFFEIFNYIFEILKFSASIDIANFLLILFIEILYNSLIIIIFYPIIHKFGNYLENVFKNKNVLTSYF